MSAPVSRFFFQLQAFGSVHCADYTGKACPQQYQAFSFSSKLSVLYIVRTIIGEVENGRDFFVAGGQTNEFLQFKFDLICLPMS